MVGAGIAYVKFGPLWRRAGAETDPEILFAALEALKREFGTKRRLVVRILPPADPDYANEWMAALKAANFSLHAPLKDRERYLVNLAISEEQQLASLGAQWRANLKKASSELVIHEPGLKTGIPIFVSLYQNMLARKKFDDKHGIDDLPAIARSAGDKLGMRLFLATHNDEPVVGSIIIGPGERVFVPFSATSDKALGLRAGYALRWAIINRLRGTSARWLDLGGAEGDSGLRHFKLGNAGKAGRVTDIPGEYDFAPNALAASAARALELGRDLVRAPALKKIVAYLPI
jgi:lipid II:glycine glycyltransferase (peptidoglycan interpeptide bridge formation enzyme)